MHPYSTNSPANPKLIATIAIIASSASYGISALMSHMHDTWGWTIGGVSALTCFGLLYLVFDRFLWRLRCARKFLLVPDLTGVWHCKGTQVVLEGTPQESAWTGTITIRQSWSRIVVALRTPQSCSRSIGASLYEEPGSGYRLIYHYENRPDVGNTEMQRHSGQCDLTFTEDVASADGEYFTGLGRLTVGTMRLTKMGSNDVAP